MTSSSSLIGAQRIRQLVCVTLLLPTLVVLAGCASSTGAGPLGAAPTKAQAATALTGLRHQASQILAGGPKAFRRLGSLRGYPVVVNQWASWCGPCRSEFPFFQRLAHRYRPRVAFLGVDSNDTRPEAAAFLKQLPVPYPTYSDPGASIARLFHGAWRGRPPPSTTGPAA